MPQHHDVHAHPVDRAGQLAHDLAELLNRHGHEMGVTRAIAHKAPTSLTWSLAFQVVGEDGWYVMSDPYRVAGIVGVD